MAAGGSGDRRRRIVKEPAEDDGDTSAATSPASGEEAAINLFWSIGSLSSPTRTQTLRMEAEMMCLCKRRFWGVWCVWRGGKVVFEEIPRQLIFLLGGSKMLGY